MATNYSRGADFERKVMKELEGCGYSVVRSAGSHSPADLVALMGGAVRSVVAIQCKRNGRLDPDEWNEFYEWCVRAGASPILASKGPRGCGILYAELLCRKDGRGRQPLGPWSPENRR